MCQSLFFNKFAGLRRRCFPVNFAKFLRTPFSTKHFWWLLLKICCRRKVQAVKSEKLEVFVVKYYDISKIYSVN